MFVDMKKIMTTYNKRLSLCNILNILFLLISMFNKLTQEKNQWWIYIL